MKQDVTIWHVITNTPGFKYSQNLMTASTIDSIVNSKLTVVKAVKIVNPGTSQQT